MDLSRECNSYTLSCLGGCGSSVPPADTGGCHRLQFWHGELEVYCGQALGICGFEEVFGMVLLLDRLFPLHARCWHSFWSGIEKSHILESFLNCT